MLHTMRTRTSSFAAALVLGVALLVAVPQTGAGAEATKRASSGCGKRAEAGSTTRHVTVDGTDREYLLSIPDRYDPAKPAPLVFDFHGLGSNMQEQSLYTKVDQQASERGYVVITPNGQGGVLRHWSLVPATTANPDVAFTQAMLRTTYRALCIDQQRVFSTGISNGAMFSTLLACALPGRLAAIAPVAGINATEVCAVGTPRVSVLAFHGTADPIVPYAGGAYFSGTPIGRVLGVSEAKPVDDAAAAWAAFDGCGSPPARSFVADDVQHLAWPDCPPNGAVQLYRVIGGGHTWPGSAALRADRLRATTASIDATELMLDFFDAHPRTR
jgi:polyhydroxybutyrate depolymerase